MFPKAEVAGFGHWITRHRWYEVLDEEDPVCKVSAYNTSIGGKIDKHFPLQTFKMSNVDKPWITPEIKQKNLMRHKLHISKKFDDRDQLNKSIKRMCYKLRTKYRNNNIHLLKNIGSKIGIVN